MMFPVVKQFLQFLDILPMVVIESMKHAPEPSRPMLPVLDLVLSIKKQVLSHVLNKGNRSGKEKQTHLCRQIEQA